METIVLLHAFGSSHRAWKPQVETLGRRFHVLTPDLPGHGSNLEPFSLDHAVAATRRLLGEQDAKVHLVGISGGASIALLTCLSTSQTTASLLLSAPVAHAPPWLALQRLAAALMPESVTLRYLREMYSGGQQEYTATAVEDFQRCGKGTFLATLREVARLDVRTRLAEIKVPTLVLCGERDRANIPSSREVAAGIPNARFRLIPEAGHLWNLETPKLFTEIVEEFIATAVEQIHQRVKGDVDER